MITFSSHLRNQQTREQQQLQQRPHQTIGMYTLTERRNEQKKIKETKNYYEKNQIHSEEWTRNT